jgi:hypothetical protein
MEVDGESAAGESSGALGKMGSEKYCWLIAGLF